MSEARICPHCEHVNPLDALRCSACGADLVAAEPTGHVPLERRSLLLYAGLFIPGVILVIYSLSTATLWLAVVGFLLLVAPLLVQLFGANWTADPHVEPDEPGPLNN